MKTLIECKKQNCHYHKMFDRKQTAHLTKVLKCVPALAWCHPHLVSVLLLWMCCSDSVHVSLLPSLERMKLHMNCTEIGNCSITKRNNRKDFNLDYFTFSRTTRLQCLYKLTESFMKPLPSCSHCQLVNIPTPGQWLSVSDTDAQ